MKFLFKLGVAGPNFSSFIGGGADALAGPLAVMPVSLLFICSPSACLLVWILPLALYYLGLVTELSRMIAVYCLLMKR